MSEMPIGHHAKARLPKINSIECLFVSPRAGHMHDYFAFGLKIQSDIEFPELLPNLPLSEDAYDVIIQQARINPDGLTAPVKSGLYFQSKPGYFWLHIPDIAYYEVTNGCDICYQLEKHADVESMRLYLLGSCFGALLHQRELLVMHGNAIRFGGQCVMFAGPSGNGKSTLAAAFHQKDFEILSDDVCVIDNELNVVPGYPQIKLWKDTADKLGVETKGMRKIRPQVEKYALRFDTGFCREPLPLAAIYFLGVHNIDQFEIEDLAGMQTFFPLRGNTYRMQYIEGLGVQAGHLQRCGELSRHVKVSRILRPDHGFRLDDMVNTICQDLDKKGIDF